jgi:non-ribosomal peptide synthetase component F
VVVGICLERSVETVVGLLGILEAGGAYLPLDPRDPPARLAFLVCDAGAPVVLTRSSWRARLATCGARLLWVDEAEAPAPDDTVAGTGAGAGGDSLAYVVYTSGSTGRPKGVEIPHRAVVRLLFGVDYVRLGPEEKILQLGPLGFDLLRGYAAAVVTEDGLETGAGVVVGPSLEAALDGGEGLDAAQPGAPSCA